MEHLMELGVFAGKTVLITGALILILVILANLVIKLKPPRAQLEIEDLNEKFDAFAEAIDRSLMDTKALKADAKKRKKRFLMKRKQSQEQRRIFVLDFEGDLRAHAVDNLRDEVSAVLATARPDNDEVLIRLESPGGVVHGYGLAAAQLIRIKQARLKLTVCVDKVAASGGYMMACTADRILAAPFAIVGSIGVIAQVPNFHRVLKKHDIDYEEITAGEFKRTVSLLGEITDKGRKKFLEQIEDTHSLFKEFVHSQRPQINLEKVATGEYWFGHRALELGLVDELKSSDDYLFTSREDTKILRISVQTRKSFSERLAENFSLALERLLYRGVI